MPEKYQRGDVVCLKSGGPPMTVEDVDTASEEGPTVICQFFAGGRVQQIVLRADEVERVEKTEK